MAKAKTEAARVMVLPRAAKARRTGAQAWIERTNPLTRLSLRAAQSIYDTARGGGYTRLQYIYAEIEKTDPTLFTCVDRRLSALSALGWRVVANVEGTKAEAQKKILEEMLDGAVGLSAAIEHMGLAFFRGYSFCEPYMRDGRLAFNCPPSWEFNRSPDGTWWHNPLVVEGDAGGEGQTAFDPEAVIHIERVRAVDYPALALYLRHEVAEDEWGRFLERYGIPPVILEMPPLAQPGDADRFAQTAQQMYEALCGAVPNGTRVNTLAEARGADPFSAFIEHQEKTMVRLCTGGTLGSIAEATGIGSGASDAQGDVWREIVSRDAVLIGEEFTRWFGRFVFPEGMLVRFELGTERRATPDEVFDTAAKARQAGYRFTKEYLETETGAELEEEPQQPQNPPGFGPLLNKAPATPLQTAKNALQNAPKVSDGQGEGQGVPALLGPFSAGFEERLLDEMFKAAADELDASHAEAEANKTDAQGNEHDDGNGQFVSKGDSGSSGAPSEKTEVKNPQTPAEYRELAKTVPAERIAEICKAEGKQPCKIEEALAVLNRNPKVRNALGEDVTFGSDMGEKYLTGRGRSGNVADPDRLKDLPIAMYAVAHDMSPHLQYLRGAIHDPLNPPRGTQRVYKTAATDGPMLARAWADSGKVTGWYVETKKPTGEGGGRKRT